jgi:hypothetical protein
MKSDPAEYKEIIKKLLEKTRQRKVEWEQTSSSGFRCTLASGDADSFSFTISYSFQSYGSQTESFTLLMSDRSGNTIFAATSNDLPISPEEEEVSKMIEEMYDLARRQALKIEQKLGLASTLLDRV